MKIKRKENELAKKKFWEKGGDQKRTTLEVFFFGIIFDKLFNCLLIFSQIEFSVEIMVFLELKLDIIIILDFL